VHDEPAQHRRGDVVEVGLNALGLEELEQPVEGGAVGHDRVLRAAAFGQDMVVEVVRQTRKEHRDTSAEKGSSADGLDAPDGYQKSRYPPG